MRLTPTPTRDSFFDPPPSDQSEVTLILGGERLECHLVEVSIGGFGVTVPRSTAWTGEPICRMLTHDAAYPVRIIRQEAQYAGFHLTLQRIQEEDVPPGEPARAAQSWIVNASRCCAVGLVAAMAYCFVATPGGSSPDARAIQTRDAAQLWNQTWTLGTWWPSGRGPAASESKPVSSTTADDATSDGLFELPAISVSLASNDQPANGIASSIPSQPMTSSRSSHASDVDPQARAIAAATRKAQIKSSLLTARRGPRWPVDSTTLPWLFSAAEPALRGGVAYRMSEAARDDLSLFEAGLRALPAATANDAARGLRRALAAASTPAPAAHPARLPFDSLPDVGLIRSEDAEIYFHLASGSVDVLRVVPRDHHDPADTARFVSPTSSQPPQSVTR